MAKGSHKNTDKVSRRQGKAFLFDSCSLFRLLNTFNLQIPIQTVIILSDRDAQITLLAWGTCGLIVTRMLTEDEIEILWQTFLRVGIEAIFLTGCLIESSYMSLAEFKAD